MTKRALTIGGAVAAAAVLIAALVLVASDDRSGQNIRLEVDGRALVSGPGESRSLGSGVHRIHLGDTVEVVDGTAVATLPGGAALELRSGLGGAVDSRVRIDEPISLLAGDLLLVTGGRELVVDAAGTRVELTEGAGRVSRFTAVTAGLYVGVGQVESAGRQVPVPALRQAVVPDLGLVPRRAEPIVYDEHDPWDRRFLAEAMRLSGELQARSQGFTTQLAQGRGTTAAFYRTTFVELADEAAFTDAEVQADRPPGETLVGLAIALEGSQGALRDRLRAVFEFRDDGAAWGLVALDQRVEREPLLARLDAAIAGSPLLFASPTGTGPGPGPGGPTQPGPGPGPSPSPTTTTTTTTVPPGGDDPPDEPEGPLPGTGTPIDEATEPINELLGGLLDDDPDGDDGGNDGSDEDGGLLGILRGSGSGSEQEEVTLGGLGGLG